MAGPTAMATLCRSVASRGSIGTTLTGPTMSTGTAPAAAGDLDQPRPECSACSGHGPFSKRQLKKAAGGERARCANCIANDSPMTSKTDGTADVDATSTADLEAELKQVRAIVAGGAVGSIEGTDAAKEYDTPFKPDPSSATATESSDANFTFGNDEETPTPLPRKRKRKDANAAAATVAAGSDVGSGGSAGLLESTKKAMDKVKTKKKKSSPVTFQSNPFLDEEAGDDDNDMGINDDDTSHDSGDDSSRNGEGGEEGVSLEALKRQILGRKIITTPSTPFSDHKDEYLNADKVMIVEPSNNTSSPMANGTTNGIMNKRSQYIIPHDLRQELQCSICHETLYQPVSLTCGHSFCQECLGWWLERNQVPRDQRSNAADANHGSCPTCRAPLPCDGRELNVNTALRACVAALMGEELTERVLAERKARLAATRGERGGAHERGYEVITPAEDGGWTKLGYTLTFRRSTVLDANDQRMQLALALWGGPSGKEPLQFDGQRLDVSLCLLSMEEDEAGESGFPRMIRDEDDEHLVCSENRFIATNVTAMAKNKDASSIPVGLSSIDEDGISTFSLDVTVGACRRASTVLFRHEESRAIFEIKIPRGDCKPSPPEERSNVKSRSYFRHGSDQSDHDSEDEFEDDGWLVADGDDEDGAQDEDEGNSEDDICCLCREHGELMVCDGGSHLAGCGRSFHVSCVDRVEVPDGDWVCKRCANAFGLDVGIEGHEFPPEEGYGRDAVVAARSSPIHIDDSSDDEGEENGVPAKMKAATSTNKTKRRRVFEDSDDED